MEPLPGKVAHWPQGPGEVEACQWQDRAAPGPSASLDTWTIACCPDGLLPLASTSTGPPCTGLGWGPWAPPLTPPLLEATSCPCPLISPARLKRGSCPLPPNGRGRHPLDLRKGEAYHVRVCLLLPGLPSPAVSTRFRFLKQPRCYSLPQVPSMAPWGFPNQDHFLSLPARSGTPPPSTLDLGHFHLFSLSLLQDLLHPCLCSRCYLYLILSFPV